MNAEMKRLSDSFSDPEPDEFGTLSDEQREAIVRAILTEMREPSRTVLKAMCKAMSPEHRPTPERVSSGEKHRIRWRAAIDAILADGK